MKDDNCGIHNCLIIYMIIFCSVKLSKAKQIIVISELANRIHLAYI